MYVLITGLAFKLEIVPETILERAADDFDHAWGDDYACIISLTSMSALVKIDRDKLWVS
jgi:hypothetical protein